MGTTTSNNFFIVFIGLLLAISLSNGQTNETEPLVGVCNGRIASDLPSEKDVVQFYLQNKIPSMRIYDPNHATLKALEAGTNIELLIGIPNGDLDSLTDPSAARRWVQRTIFSYIHVKFRIIVVGNEVDATSREAAFVLTVMRNIHDALVESRLGCSIMVSTAVQPTVLGTSYPPSAGKFDDKISDYILPIIDFLKTNDMPILVNVYPYFSYLGDPENIALDYALFKSPKPVVQDGEYSYQNLFDATLDAIYAALEKVDAHDMYIIVSETGWPSAGGPAATVENAGTYYKNVMEHVKKGGTPRRPGNGIETFLFAMFDENQKGPAQSECHFGLFTPDKQSKYGVKFD